MQINHSSGKSVLNFSVDEQLELDNVKPDSTAAQVSEIIPASVMETKPQLRKGAPSKKAEHAAAGQAQASALRFKLDKETGGEYPVMREGDTGPRVLDLQERLNDWRRTKGFPPIKENGVYDQETFDAVVAFQTDLTKSKTDLKPLDGIAGPQTLKALGVLPKLKPNSDGPAVKDLQKFLNLHRQVVGLPPLAVDGNYGNKTQEAVREYQRSKGLKTDGVAGFDTMAHVKRDLENLERESKGPFPQQRKTYDINHVVPATNQDDSQTAHLSDHVLTGEQITKVVDD